jgi:hypothetical protein
LPSDTILVLLTASSDVIVKRMENSPHEYRIIRREDIPLLLQKFEEEYGASTIHAKIRIDTTDQSPEEALQEFLNKARPYLASEDLLRIVANEYRRSWRAATAVFMCDMKLRRAGRAHVLQPLFEGLLRALSWSTSCSSH